MINLRLINSSSRTVLKQRICSVICATVCTTLTSCGSGGDSELPQFQDVRMLELPADQITRVGIVSLQTQVDVIFGALDTSTRVSGYATFKDYGQPISQAFIDYGYSGRYPSECKIDGESADNSQEVIRNEILGIDEYGNPDNVLAGNALSISTPSGSWPDLVPDNGSTSNDGLTYRFNTDTSNLGSLAQGSVVNIPGDEFPAFSNIPIPFVPLVTDFSVSNTEDGFFNSGSKITWAVPENPATQSYIAFSIFHYDRDPTHGQPIGDAVYIHCTTPDTGEFSLPDNMQQFVTDNKVSSSGIIVSRTGLISQVKGDSAVIIYNDSHRFDY